jgi:hypothetical protein
MSYFIASFRQIRDYYHNLIYPSFVAIGILTKIFSLLIKKEPSIDGSQYVDKPRTDQLDFVVRARIRTVAQFEIPIYKRFPATVRPEADN